MTACPRCSIGSSGRRATTDPIPNPEPNPNPGPNPNPNLIQILTLSLTLEPLPHPDPKPSRLTLTLLALTLPGEPQLAAHRLWYTGRQCRLRKADDASRRAGRYSVSSQ